MAILQYPTKQHLTLPSAQSPSLQPGLHLSAHLLSKLCTYPAPLPAHSIDHPRKYHWAFLPCTFAYAFPKAGMLFFLCSSYWNSTPPTNAACFLWKAFLIFDDLPLSFPNSFLCISITALHFASCYNHLLPFTYCNLFRARISYHLFLKLLYRYFSKCSQQSPLSESSRTLQISLSQDQLSPMQGIFILTSSPVVLGHKVSEPLSYIIQGLHSAHSRCTRKKAHMANNTPGGQSKLAFVLFLESQNVRDKWLQRW